MKNYPIQIKQFGEKAILIEWQSAIDSKIFDEIVAFKNTIQNDEIVDFVIAYNSLTIKFKHLFDFNFWQQYLLELYKKERIVSQFNSILWNIPVCFDTQFATDLKDLAKAKKLSEQTFIQQYCSIKFQLTFYGFQPGFPYLSNLPKRLALDRKETPVKVTAGSVAIGGNQTGIYPANYLGGWHVIGKTPITFFDVEQNQPCFINSGDFIKFHKINLYEFMNIKNQIQQQKFTVNSLIND